MQPLSSKEGDLLLFGSKERLSLKEFIWGRHYAVLREEEFDSSTYEDFWLLNENNESLCALLVAYVSFTVIQAPTYHDFIQNSDKVLFVLPAIGLFTVFLSMWISLFYQCFSHYLPNTSWHSFWRQRVPSLRIYTAIGSTTFFIFRLLVLATSSECHKNLFQSSKWNCVPPLQTTGIPGEVCMSLLLFPIVFSGIFREVDVRIFLSLWAATVVALFISFRLSHLSYYNALVTIYIVPSLIIIFETYRYNHCIALFTMALRKTMKEKDENADQVHATEMRHMIANVAHDLKTPLTSFLSGIEVIADIASETQKKVDENAINLTELHESVSSILKCITNIRNTNSFMLMTINRCIDYTKASKGLKLVPKYETIDLMDTLLLPLNCMKDIQQRVSIVLEPWSKDICSHIITDKQWLQENVLCLLSNAVKYSSEGEVTVELKVVNEKSPKNESDESFLQKALTSFVLPSFEAWKGNAKVHPVEREHSSSVGDELSLQNNLKSSSRDSSSYSLMKQASSVRQDRTHNAIHTHYLCIEIEDHGIGLSEDAMDNLFNPFKQAQRLAGGTGLGLYSLARRVEALNGLYGVSRRRDGGQGSLFWFSIPYRPDRVTASSIRRVVFPRRQDVHSDSETILGQTSSIPNREIGSEDKMIFVQSVLSNDTLQDQPVLFEKKDKPIPLRSNFVEDAKVEKSFMDILLVDDSPAIAKMMSMMLMRLGHRITIAENGDVALKKIIEKMESSQTAFDVVLMDLQMPVMDGLEATRRLRVFESSGRLKSSEELDQEATVSSANLPWRRVIHQLVIGVSANSDHETMQDALNAGVDGFMGKPFTIDTFYDTYEKAKLSALVR